MTASLLEVRNRSINQIQSIFQSKKAKNINKQSTKVVADVAILFKNN